MDSRGGSPKRGAPVIEHADEFSIQNVLFHLVLWQIGEAETRQHQMIVAGVRGFLLKSDARNHLVTAVHTLLDYQSYFTNEVLEKLLHAFLLRKKVLLSVREQSVVK